MKKKILASVVLMFSFLIIILPNNVGAFSTEKTGTSNQGDFAISSGKMEINLDAGEGTKKTISITNRTGSESKFKIEVEDFGPSNDGSNSTQFYGDKAGPYSLRNYLKPELTEFTLKQGEKANLDIAIDVPGNAPAGDLYGSVMVTRLANIGESTTEKIGGNVGLNSRLGVLFFVRVNGNIKESGQIKNFFAGNKFYFNGPIELNYAIKNTGNVYIKTNGSITVTNIFGSKTDELKVDQNIILPNSSKEIKTSWARKFMFGRYTATLDLGSGIEKQTTNFWVIPAPVIIIIFLVIVALIAIAISGEKNKPTEKKKVVAKKKTKGKKK